MTTQAIASQVARVVGLCNKAGIPVVRHEPVAPPCRRDFGGEWAEFEATLHCSAAAFWFESFDTVIDFQTVAVHVEEERDEFGCSWGNYGRLGWWGMLADFGLVDDYGEHGKAVPYEDLPLLITALERELQAQAIDKARGGLIKRFVSAVTS